MELLALYASKSSIGSDIPGMVDWYWSSTPVSGSPSDAWDVYFGNGFTHNVVKTAWDGVRCVR